MGTIVVFGVVASIVIDLLRTIFFVIDGLVYGLAGLFFSFAMEFVNLNDFINLSNVLSRMNEVVYSFLSIVMFFRVAFSLLQWLVDPSRMEDKEGGAKKIVVNIMICLLLIVAVPKVFDVAMDIQDKVIKENIIGEALYGAEGEGIEVSNVGKSLSRATWGLFLRPAQNLIDINFLTDEVKLWNNYFDVSQGVNDDANALMNLFQSLNAKSAILFGNYKFSYLFLISTIAGIYLCWTFIKIAIDFAYRALKMFMLQLLSPIAIISYVDPKSSKNGIFAKWLKETMKTYLSIFTRIACYSVAALLMNEFTRALYGRETSTINAILRDTIGINGDTFIALIYILAIVAFVKNAPKFIDGILGTEISKGSETKFAHDLLRAGFGAIGGAASGAIGGAVVAKAKGLPMGASVAQGLKNGVKQGWANGKKGGFEGAINAGKTMYSGFTGESARKYFGVPTPEEERKNRDHQLQVDAMKDVVTRGEASKKAAIQKADAEITAGGTRAEKMFGGIVNKNGYDMNLYNEYTKEDAEAQGAIKKAAASMATNNEMGLNNTLPYEKEIQAKMIADIATRIKVKADADYNTRITSTSDDSKRQQLHQAGITNASTLTGKDLEDQFEKLVLDQIQAQCGLRLDELANFVAKAQSDAKDATKAVEEYEKTQQGAQDKLTKSLYSEAKRKKESGY